MSPDELRTLILAELHAIAPEADLTHLDPDEDLREALDLDSMDVLRFATALHERLHVDIPESAYPEITTIRGCIDYLMRAR